MDEQPKNIIDVEELIEIANSEGETTSKQANNIDPLQVEVRDFIRSNNIQASKVYVPLELIYYYYTEQSSSPLTRNKFYSIFSQYFPKKRIRGKDCCKIQPKAIGLPEYYSIYKDPVFNKAAKKFSTRFKGVYSVSGYYIARIELEDGKHYLGRFKTEKEAAAAYDLSAYYHFGHLTKLNFPDRIKEYDKEVKKENQEKN
jgi:hypothetical protein